MWPVVLLMYLAIVISVYLMLLFIFWNWAAYISEWKAAKAYMDPVTNEKECGFGQIVPMFMLLLLAMRFIGDLGGESPLLHISSLVFHMIYFLGKILARLSRLVHPFLAHRSLSVLPMRLCNVHFPIFCLCTFYAP
jgi:hypothetical protein